MDDFAAPFDHFYWVVPGKPATGCSPGAPVPFVAKLKVTVLIEAGIRLVINLIEQDEAKRLFLWFSERHNHAWLSVLITNDLDLGLGLVSG